MLPTIVALFVLAAAVVLLLDDRGNAARAETIPGADAPTFSRDIAPIIYANCTGCHREGEIAPFPLVSYEQIAGRADKIAELTGTREMPPWKAAPDFGSHADVRRLSDEQIALIRAWADAGAPEGDAAATPKPPTFPSGSQLGTPDLVLKMSAPYLHKGTGKDMYRCFVIPTGLLENRDIAAIEFRPGNPKIVHHALMFLDTTGTARRKDAADPDGGYLGFGGPGFDAAATYIPWVPGAVARFFPPGLTGKMYRNSDLVIQIHYAPSDSDMEDQSSVNLFFAKPGFSREVLQFAMSPQNLIDGPFIIPAGQKRRFTARYTVPADVSLLAVAPHMHLLGAMMKTYAVKPEGDTIPFVLIDDWDFHWQGAYTFKKIVKVPRGSTLVVESMYDNTADNPENPNTPPRVVTWGESTLDEMMLCYFFYTIYFPGDENIVLETPPPVAAVGAVGRAAAASLACTPNPLAGAGVVRLTLPAATRVNVALYDALGCRVAVLADGRYGVGSTDLPLERGSLPAGLYFCRLSGEGVAATAVPVVLR